MGVCYYPPPEDGKGIRIDCDTPLGSGLSRTFHFRSGPPDGILPLNSLIGRSAARRFPHMTVPLSLRRTAVGLVFAGLFVAGPACSSGGRLHPVKGQVTVNGEPAAGAVVVFHPDGATIQSVPPTALVGADGTFTMATGDQPGAAAGTYVVTVTWPDTSKKPSDKQI